MNYAQKSVNLRVEIELAFLDLAEGFLLSSVAVWIIVLGISKSVFWEIYTPAAGLFEAGLR